MTDTTGQSNLEKARAAWGAAIPDWVDLLARACDAANQTDVAKRLGRTSPYVSRIIRNSYIGGDLAEAERLVRGALSPDRHYCRVTFCEILPSQCLDYRRGRKLQDFAFDFRRNCPDCPHNLDNTQRRNPC